jgi:4-hydroxybenzoate polyprenyltransferase
MSATRYFRLELPQLTARTTTPAIVRCRKRPVATSRRDVRGLRALVVVVAVLSIGLAGLAFWAMAAYPPALVGR